jgi:hypothetical protein
MSRERLIQDTVPDRGADRSAIETSGALLDVVRRLALELHPQRERSTWSLERPVE